MMIGKVGALELKWKSAPRGEKGSSTVEVGGKTLAVSWRKDADGIWIELPHGVFGFDMAGELDDQNALVYRVRERGSHLSWNALSFTRAGDELVNGAVAGKKKGVRVRAQMPGKIVRVLVEPGSDVEKDQTVMVMEAMKMENEIRVPQAGKVDLVKVIEGQSVESGADLLTLA